MDSYERGEMGLEATARARPVNEAAGPSAGRAYLPHTPRRLPIPTQEGETRPGHQWGAVS
jgi:hypothetical protein